MKKPDQPLDDLFREVLGDYTVVPPDAARKATLEEALKVKPSGRRGKGGVILLSGILILAVSGVIAWLLIRPGEAASPRSAMSAAITPAPVQKTAVASPRGSSAQPVTTMNNSASDHTNVSDPSTGISAASSSRTRLPDHSSGKTVMPPSSSMLIAKSIPVSAESATRATMATDPVTTTPAGTSPPAPASQLPTTSAPEGKSTAPPDTLQKAVPPPGKPDRKEPIVIRKWSLSGGLYFSPELMFNTLEDNKYVNNFGLEGTFHFGRFSIRTGAGLSISKGANELEVEYNDYLGTYQRLDSMDFNWNPQGMKYIPTYYTTSQDVWDSLMKMDYPKVVKRYTYLQIPMIMGYDFLQHERFSLGFRVGPVMSVLLASKQLSTSYDPGNKRIISVNDISPGQVSLNWQAMAGIGAAFRISREWAVELEPSVRYYFNSVYEKPATSMKPWSVGLRCAILMNFIN